jgi:hypothetical protein
MNRRRTIRASLLLMLIGLTVACEKKQQQTKIPAANGTQSEPFQRTESSPKQTRSKKVVEPAEQIAALIDPAKLATLRERGANPRIYKITAILWTAKSRGKKPEEIIGGAIQQIGWGGTQKGDLTQAAILRNLEIAEKLGSTTYEDIAEMKKGQSPVVRKGPHAGDILSVDHIIPVAAAPELSNCIANLELMPLKLNQSKNDQIGARQRDLANKLHTAGLLENPSRIHR